MAKQTERVRYSVADPENLSPDSSHGMVLDWVPPGKTVLEFGPGPGTMTRHLNRRAGMVVCVEADPEFARQSRNFADELIQGDIEDPQTWSRLQSLGKRYDVVIFSDVLEHLKDPWTTLKRTRELLTDDGKIVASIPNVAHWSVRWDLLRGKFLYQDEGLLDRTHLRFFTVSTIRDLFESTGYSVRKQAYTHRNDFILLIRIFLGILPPFETWLRHRFPNFFGYQVIVEAVPSLR